MLLPVLLPRLQNRKGVINDTVPSQKACMLQTSQIMLFGSFFFFLRSSKGYVPAQLFCILALSVYQANNMFVRHESPQVPHWTLTIHLFFCVFCHTGNSVALNSNHQSSAWLADADWQIRPKNSQKRELLHQFGYIWGFQFTYASCELSETWTLASLWCCWSNLANFIKCLTSHHMWMKCVKSICSLYELYEEYGPA